MSINIKEILGELGITELSKSTSTGNKWFGESSDIITSFSPVDGKKIADTHASSEEDLELVVRTAQEAFKYWRKVPAPKRGEIVRLWGERLRELKHDESSLKI